jgi:hypothetical protein
MLALLHRPDQAVLCAGPLRAVATLRDRSCSPVRLARGRAAATGAGDCTYREMQTAGGGLPGGHAERFGMCPTVMLGQNLAEAAGLVRHGALADLATGDRQPGNGHREAAGRWLAHLLL